MRRHASLDVSQRTGLDEYLPPLPLLAIVCAAGVAIGWLVSQFSPGTRIGVEAFRHNPWYTIWSSLGAIFVALWLLLGCVALSQIWSLSLEEGGNRSSCAKRVVMPVLGYLFYGAAVGVLAVILSSRVRPGPAMPLSHSAVRVYIFEVAAVLGGAPSAAGLGMIKRRASSLHAVTSGSLAELLNGLDAFLVFRGRSQQFLAMLSTVVATAVLQTSTLRYALVGSGVVKSEQYPPEFILLYGAFFALAIAIVYLPPEFELRQAGRTMLDMAVKRGYGGPLGTDGNEVEHWLQQADQRGQHKPGAGIGRASSNPPPDFIWVHLCRRSRR